MSVYPTGNANVGVIVLDFALKAARVEEHQKAKSPVEFI
jgi:hypothetical protein